VSDIVQYLTVLAVVFGGAAFLSILVGFWVNRKPDPPYVHQMTGRPWEETALYKSLQSSFQPAQPPPPPDPPINVYEPTPDTSVYELTKLRDSCLSLFDKKPLKSTPSVFIEEDDHFDSTTTRAHYHTAENQICFRKGYLDKGTPQQWVNTMKHELLHAWIHQHDFRGDRAHDDLFKAAAELLGIEWWEGYRES
jgi:hypothetical protein